jgi:hypothetical protein
MPARGLEDLPLNVPGPPWDYNPSAWSQRVPICLLAIVGFLISTYMGLYQWHLIEGVWDPLFGSRDAGKNGTEYVVTSPTSHTMYSWFHIPDAVFGAFAYLGDAVFGLAGSTRRWQYRPWMVLIFGFDVIPLGVVSVILIVMQGLVVGEWCFLCLATAMISLILIYMAYDEVFSSLLYLYRVWKKTHDKGVLWKTFWGTPTPQGYEVAEELIAETRRKAALRHGHGAKAAA